MLSSMPKNILVLLAISCKSEKSELICLIAKESEDDGKS